MRSPDLRRLIADALYPTKAYDLPSLCERLGLRSGDTGEAYSSKTRYVTVRLKGLGEMQVLAVAKKVAAEFPDDALIAALENRDAALRRVSPITRRHLAEALNEFSLSGKLSLLEMVREHWPSVDELPSGHDPFGKLADDINRHAVVNGDWDNEELLERVGFLRSSQLKLFAFLEDFVSPIRRDRVEQEHAVAKLNGILRRDRFCLAEAENTSGYPTYRVVETAGGGAVPGDDLISLALAAFDETGVNEVWARALDRRDRDPEGAITAAKALLESVCKHIIEGANRKYGATDDLPRLYHAAAALLNLAPSQHAEEAFRKILGNCQSVVGGLADIRNKLGDAHGKGKRPVKPQPRHAKFAVNLAGTMAMFLVETWAARGIPSGEQLVNNKR